MTEKLERLASTNEDLYEGKHARPTKCYTTARTPSPLLRIMNVCQIVVYVCLVTDQNNRYHIACLLL